MSECGNIPSEANGISTGNLIEPKASFGIIPETQPESSQFSSEDNSSTLTDQDVNRLYEIAFKHNIENNIMLNNNIPVFSRTK